MMNMTETVKQLIIVNVIFFIGGYFVPTAYNYLALYYFENDSFKLWQPLTSMFMHAPLPNLMHIFFNMFALFSFGSALEHFWGGKKFLFFYISCGLGASLLHTGVSYFEMQSILSNASDLNLTNNELHQILNAEFKEGMYFKSELLYKNIEPILQKSGKLNLLNETNFKSLFDAAILNNSTAVGASGAIYGLLVAFAFMFPNAGLALIFLPVPIKAKYFVPGLLLLDLFLGVKGKSIFGGGTGIAHFAHIGGAVIGFIMMSYWKKNQFNDNRWN